MPFKSYRDESRANWGSITDKDVSTEQIKLGALLRIADATENMAKNFLALQDELARVKESRDYFMQKCERYNRRQAGLLGTITRMKKQKGTADARRTRDSDTQ